MNGATPRPPCWGQPWNNVYLAYTDLQMQALSEQKVDGHCADILSTDTDITDYTSIDHRIIQNDHVYDVMST